METASSPSLARRERERTETRRKILEAARRMFVQYGYEATTMRAIAAKIGYTPTAIYHHFRNKEALLTELSTQDFRALAQAFQQIGQVADPVERLRRIGKAYVEFGLTHPMHYRLMFMTPHPRVNDAKHGIAQGDPSQDAYAFLVQPVSKPSRADGSAPNCRIRTRSPRSSGPRGTGSCRCASPRSTMIGSSGATSRPLPPGCTT